MRDDAVWGGGDYLLRRCVCLYMKLSLDEYRDECRNDYANGYQNDYYANGSRSDCANGSRGGYLNVVPSVNQTDDLVR